MTTTAIVEVSAPHGGLPYLFATADARDHLGVLAVIHGHSRRAVALAEAFVPQATAVGFSVLAPSFSASRYGGYQRLRGDGRPLGAAAAFDRTYLDAIQRFELVTHQMSLVGFSAGAQFAHRYAMTYPARVRSLAVVAAGWYTMPDPLVAFPYGCAPSTELPDGIRALDDFLALPIRVFVGENDVGDDERLRSSAALDASQGAHRLGRARTWTRAVDEAARHRGIAGNVSLELLPRSTHSLQQVLRRGGLVPRALAFLAEAQR